MEMTQKWIAQYNRKCADLIGYEISENKECFKLPNKNGWITLNVFHSDWNWIMKVVEKIESLENIYFQIEEKSCYVYNISKFSDERMDSFIQQNGKTKKQAVVQAIDQFIDWYNKQKENEI